MALIPADLSAFWLALHSDGGMKIVSKKKPNKQKTKVPPMSEERVLELNEMMFSYNPQKNRRDPRLKVRGGGHFSDACVDR